MEPWTIHHFQREAASIHPEPIVSNLSDYIRNLKQLNIPVIFSLAHLSKITHLDMDFLINSINFLSAIIYCIISGQKVR